MIICAPRPHCASAATRGQPFALFLRTFSAEYSVTMPLSPGIQLAAAMTGSAACDSASISVATAGWRRILSR